MNRISLNPGAIINGTRTYVIDSVIGNGATCIVYDAHYVDNHNYSHNVRLKECFPFGIEIERKEDNLVWENADDKANSLSAFANSYHKLMANQNGNFTVSAYDIFEINNTMYIVMDANEGETFDKCNLSIKEILNSVKLLTHVIGEYHKNGYLHLDVKPENFLVYPRPSEHIVLFDLDSVTSIEDIKSGKVQCVPYSKNWAAPEQMQGTINKLCPATDIFSIGAILFEKIMSRKVTNSDTGIFAEWDFDDNELFEKINPKIKRLLSEVFHKTLSANIKRRYQCANELLAALDEVINVAIQKQYIKSYLPARNKLFIGRNNEISEIDDAFTSGKKCVILQGFMGMGKSALALQYAANYKANYDAVCWVDLKKSNFKEALSVDANIKSSLNRLIVNSSKNNGDNLDFDKLITYKTLIIVDNYDVENITPYLKELLSLDCKVIITTRTAFKNITNDYCSIKLGGLQNCELLSLFEIESGKHFEETDKLYDFFEAQNNLTYSIILGANQIKESCITLDEYLQDVYSEQHEENIIYDDCEDTLLNHYRRRAGIDRLDDEEKEILRTVFVMSYAIDADTTFVDSENGVFDRAVFKAYTSMNLNKLNSLIRRRIVVEDENGELSLHSSIRQITEKDLNPSCQNCPHLYANIKARIGFTINQCSISCGVVADINGIIREDEETRIHELFNIYTWLCETDCDKEKHIYNLFALLTADDFSENFLNFTNEKPIWHLDWINREYFIGKLYECLQSEKGQYLFSDDNYLDYLPDYDLGERATLSFIRICCALIKYLSYPYYSDYQGTFVFLLQTLMSVKQPILNDKKLLSSKMEYINVIIQTLEPICRNCCPISKTGEYSFEIEESQYLCVAEGYEYDNFPFTVGVNAYNSPWTYLLYNNINTFLMMWIYGIKNGLNSASKEEFKARKDWQQQISVELYRIDKGFNHFFDFYRETPDLYNGGNYIDESAIAGNAVYVAEGFDEDTSLYVDEIMQTLSTTRKPYYLYSILLDARFPLTNVAYDLLVEQNFGGMIATDIRLSDKQKTNLFKKTVEQYAKYVAKWDDTDVKRLASDKKYYIDSNGVINVTENDGQALDIYNHIVVMWYQIMMALCPVVQLSKSLKKELYNKIQSKYIESMCDIFDEYLYKEYDCCLIKEIPEFQVIDSHIYNLFKKEELIGSEELILANVIYSFAKGLNCNYDNATIINALETYIKSLGDRYNPYVEHELLHKLFEVYK